MDQDTLFRLKEAALRQFNFTAPDGTCREGVALLTSCGIIFGGFSNNNDASSAVHTALELHANHIGTALKDGFTIVAAAIAISTTANGVRDKTLDDLVNVKHSCDHPEVFLITAETGECRFVNVQEFAPV